MWCYTLLPKILNMSLTAGIVIVLVLLARLPLKKAPKIFSYALWAVVLFRLLCPITFSSNFSLLGIFHAPTVTDGSIAYIPTDIVHTTNPQVNLPLPGVSKVINNTLPQGEEQIGAGSLEAPMAIATLLWLGGMAAILIYSAVSFLSLHRKLVGVVLLRENIYLADHITTPFVIGVIRPKIYLPSTLSVQEQGYIILHEQTHISRLDPIVKLVAFLSLAVHWFNPLVWVAFICCVKDMEMSCDEAVIKKLGDGIRTEYSASLLSLATGRKILADAPLAFGEGDTKSRINNVLNYKKPAFWVLLVAVVVIIVMGIGLLTNPASTSSIAWVKSLTSSDIQSIELVVMPSNENERYKKYEQHEFQEIVNLVRQSRGSLVMFPLTEYKGGGAITFYITTNDGYIHTFSNFGNSYLIIDGDEFDAGYDWLSGWEFSGNMAVPDGFWERVNAPVGGASQTNGDQSPIATKTHGTEYISTIDIGGTSIDIYEDETISKMMKDLHKFFISEVSTRYSVDISSLPIATQFYKGSKYGDVWIVSTADKENKYEAIIEYETDRIIEMGKKQQ